MPSAKRIELELYRKEYLIGKTIRWQRIPPHGDGDGELCVFCWKQFSASHEIRNEGFLEGESGDWICFPCMEAFLDSFGWQIKWPIEIPEIGPNGVPIY